MPHPFPPSLHDKYAIHEWRHASAILANDFPNELAELVDMLDRFRLPRSWILEPGGQKSQIAQWIDGELGRTGWHARVEPEHRLREAPAGYRGALTGT